MTPNPRTPSGTRRTLVLALVFLLGLPSSLIASPPASIDDAIYSERRFLGSNVATDVFHLGPGGVARLIYTVGRGPATDYKDVYIGSEQLTYAYTPPTGDAPLVATLTLSGGTHAFDRTRTLTFSGPESNSGSFGGTDSFELLTRQSLTGVANVSNRLWLHPGETNITGFVLTEPRLVLIRGIGPTLSRFDVATPASGTSITLYRGTTAEAANDQWGVAGPDAQGMGWIFGLAAAFSLPSGSADSALLVSLGSGAYTTHVRTDDPAQRGEALLEVYILPYE
jgi:hypothetical protein